MQLHKVTKHCSQLSRGWPMIDQDKSQRSIYRSTMFPIVIAIQKSNKSEEEVNLFKEVAINKGKVAIRSHLNSKKCQY